MDGCEYMAMMHRVHPLDTHCCSRTAQVLSCVTRLLLLRLMSCQLLVSSQCDDCVAVPVNVQVMARLAWCASAPSRRCTARFVGASPAKAATAGHYTEGPRLVVAHVRWHTAVPRALSKRQKQDMQVCRSRGPEPTPPIPLALRSRAGPSKSHGKSPRHQDSASASHVARIARI